MWRGGADDVATHVAWLRRSLAVVACFEYVRECTDVFSLSVYVLCTYAHAPYVLSSLFSSNRSGVVDEVMFGQLSPTSECRHPKFP